jgi:hypothetical protein
MKVLLPKSDVLRVMWCPEHGEIHARQEAKRCDQCGLSLLDPKKVKKPQGVQWHQVTIHDGYRAGEGFTDLDNAVQQAARKPAGGVDETGSADFVCYDQAIATVSRDGRFTTYKVVKSCRVTWTKGGKNYNRRPAPGYTKKTITFNTSGEEATPSPKGDTTMSGLSAEGAMRSLPHEEISPSHRQEYGVK